MKIGYTLSSEEFGPKELIKYGQLAESSGFDFLMISDHFHPWLDKGQAPFCWEIIGALSQVIKNIEIGTGVTPLVFRYHPTLVAQMAMTAQILLNGKFVLGVGTGENLNEHVVGMGWPPIDIRRDMLSESLEIIKILWQGGYKTYHGNYYDVEDAQIYSLYKKPPKILISAFGPVSAKKIGGLGDGFITTSPNKKLIDTYVKNTKKPGDIYGQMSVCFAKSQKEAAEIMVNDWPLVGLPRPLSTELRKPVYFKKTGELIKAEDLSGQIPMGTDTKKVKESISKYEEAGFTHLYIHNIGPYQEEFIKWFTKEFK